MEVTAEMFAGPQLRTGKPIARWAISLSVLATLLLTPLAPLWSAWFGAQEPECRMACARKGTKDCCCKRRQSTEHAEHGSVTKIEASVCPPDCRTAQQSLPQPLRSIGSDSGGPHLQDTVRSNPPASIEPFPVEDRPNDPGLLQRPPPLS